MSEWSVVAVIVTLVGLFVTIGKPIINLNTSIVKLNENLKEMRTDHNNLKTENTAAHKRLWDHNNEQDAEIENHKMRLHDLDGK